MGFGPFTLISMIYVVIGIRSVVRLVNAWGSVWDRRFTRQDRQLVDEAAFFVLVPISVALHEFGHAVVVWLHGGEVLDFGYYGFAGYVSFNPFGFSDVARTMVAAAGSLVNLVLCLIVLGLVFLKPKPFRAAINELLIQFAVVSGANAFILYPLLDLASNMNGDWRQMYDSGVPWLSGLIVAVQVGVIAFGYFLFSSPALKARIAQLTDVPPGLERGLLGGLQPGKIEVQALSPRERIMREAVERVQSGWPTKVETGLQRFEGGTAMTVAWRRDGVAHAVAVRSFANEQTDVVLLNTNPDVRNSHPRRIHSWPTLPGADELTMVIRLAMEAVDQGTGM